MGVLCIPFRVNNCGIIPLRVLTCTMMTIRAVMGTFRVFWGIEPKVNRTVHYSFELIFVTL